MNEDESDLESIKFGATQFQYPRDEPESTTVDRHEHALRIATWMASLIYSGETVRSRALNCSVGLAILRNDLNFQEVALYHGVTTKRVRQIAEKVKRFRISQ